MKCSNDADGFLQTLVLFYYISVVAKKLSMRHGNAHPPQMLSQLESSKA